MKEFTIWIHIPATGERGRHPNSIRATDIIEAQQRVATQLHSDALNISPQIVTAEQHDSTALVRWRSVEVYLVDEAAVQKEATHICTLLTLPKL